MLAEVLNEIGVAVAIYIVMPVSFIKQPVPSFFTVLAGLECAEGAVIGGGYTLVGILRSNNPSTLTTLVRLAGNNVRY